MEVDLKHKGAAAAVPGQRRVRWLAPVHTIGSDEHPFIDKFVQIFVEVCCQGSYKASFCHPSTQSSASMWVPPRSIRLSMVAQMARNRCIKLEG